MEYCVSAINEGGNSMRKINLSKLVKTNPIQPRWGGIALCGCF